MNVDEQRIMEQWTMMEKLRKPMNIQHSLYCRTCHRFCGIGSFVSLCEDFLCQECFHALIMGALGDEC